MKKETKDLIQGDLDIARDSFRRNQYGSAVSLIGLAIKRFGEEIELQETGDAPPKKERELAVPTVHLNGTSKEDLIEQLLEAGSAVRVAVEKLNAAWPNGRDYYVQSPRAFAEADAQWNERRKKLLDVMEELAAITERIDDEAPDRGY
jgi:hypothetical protein